MGMGMGVGVGMGMPPSAQALAQAQAQGDQLGQNAGGSGGGSGSGNGSDQDQRTGMDFDDPMVLFSDMSAFNFPTPGAAFIQTPQEELGLDPMDHDHDHAGSALGMGIGNIDTAASGPGHALAPELSVGLNGLQQTSPGEDLRSLMY